MDATKKTLEELVARLKAVVTVNPTDRRARYALGHARSALTNYLKAMQLDGKVVAS